MNKITLTNGVKKIILSSVMLLLALTPFYYGFADNPDSDLTALSNNSKVLAYKNIFFAPSISLVVDGTPLDAVEGSPGCNLVLYEITVTNTGDENLENVVLSDDLLDGIITGPSESINENNILEVGEVWTYSAAYIPTPQEKIDDQIETLTTVTANVEGQIDQVVNENDATIIALPSCPLSDEIAIIKTGIPLDALEGGPGCNIIIYTFTVTNEGGNNLENVVLNDPLLGGDLVGPDNGDDNNNNVLEPGEIWVYNVPYITTVQDKFAEEVINQAVATANIEGDLNNTVIDLSDDNSIDENDPTIVALPSCPSKTDIAVVKTGVALEDVEAGPGCNLILYEFTVTNEGVDILENVVLNDPLLGGDIAGPISGDENNDGFLNTNENWIYSAAYNTTQEDLNNGFVENQATVYANFQGFPNQLAIDLSDDNSVLENDPTIVDLSFCAMADIALIKEGTVVDVDADGCMESILYTFTVTNTGNLDLFEILVEDALLNGEVPGPIDGTDDNDDGILSVGETWTYQAIYAITQDDIDNTIVVNQATATGLTLADIQVSDLSDDNSLLEDGPTRTGVPDDACTEGSSSIGLIKEGVVVDVDGDGCMESILYTFTVTNTGNVNLDELILTDEKLFGPNPIVGPIDNSDIGEDGILSVGETWTYEALYAITQEDIDNEIVVNQAKVNSEIVDTEISVSDLSHNDSLLKDGFTRTPVPDDACTDGSADIGLIKEGTVVDFDGDGCMDSILYTFTVTNTGNVDLDELILTDEKLFGPNPIAGPIDNSDIGEDGILSVGETWTYEALYAITQEDIDNEIVVNQAKVNGEIVDTEISVSDLSHNDSLLKDGFTRTPVPDDACTDGPGVGLIKVGTVVDTNADGCLDSILYTFTVTNTGNVDLDELILIDEKLFGPNPIVGPIDNSDIGEDGILSVGETWTYEVLYAITQEDIDNEIVVNQAKVNGKIVDTEISVFDLSHNDSLLKDGFTRTPVPDDACTDGPGIGLIKIGVVVDVDGDGCLDSILYTFTVTNTGSSDLDDISLKDFNLFENQDIVGPKSESITENNILEVGETWIYEALYAITQEDIDNQSVLNQATVSGEVVDTEISIFDLSDNDSLLENDPTRTPVPDDACTEGSADIGLIKEGLVVDVDGDGCLESILYTFTVTNTGNVDLTELILNDEKLFEGQNISGPVDGSDDNNDGILSIDETWVYEALYPIKQVDIDNQVVINQATVLAELVDLDIQIGDLSDDDSYFENDTTNTPVPNDACPGDGGGDGDGTPLYGIAIIKTGEGVDADFDGCDDSINYSFRVINSGILNLENIVVNDELLGGSINELINTEETEDGVLQPGEEWLFTATYNLTQEDIDGIFVNNQAVVTADILDSVYSIFDNSDDNSYLENDITSINVSSFCEFAGGDFDFKIYNGITPNGDGMNDYFKILGIENYPDNNVKIFNRWGVMVYQTDSYGQGNNLFYGISEGRATLQSERELPSGTYFYILSFTGDENPGKESYSGYLYINRD